MTSASNWHPRNLIYGCRTCRKMISVYLNIMSRYLVIYFLCGASYLVTSLRILTKNMIASPDYRREPVEFLPIALKVHGGTTEDFRRASTTEEPTSASPDEIYYNDEITDENDKEDLYDDAEPPTTDQPEGRAADEESDEDNDDDRELRNAAVDFSYDSNDGTAAVNKTIDRDRGIGGDIWLMMTRAYECLWTGYTLDCFSSRVVPLFRSMMGYYSPYPNPYLIPRDGLETAKGHLHRRRKLLPIVIGLLMLKFVVLPALGGIALATGKALLFSMLALGAAAFSSLHSNRYADKRLDHTPQHNYYQYQ